MNSEAEQSVEGDDGIYHAALVLKTIAHPLRLKVLCVLGKKEMCVHDLVEVVGGCSQSNISQHLAILRSQGVLTTRKVANRVLYHISDTRTMEIVRMMGEVFSSSDSSSCDRAAHTPEVHNKEIG